MRLRAEAELKPRDPRSPIGLDPAEVYSYVSAPYRPYLSDRFTFTREYVNDTISRILDAMQHDKKVVAGRLHFVLPTAIGAYAIVGDVTAVQDQDLELAVRRALAEMRSRYVLRFERLRKRSLRLADSQGYLTDEGVFRDVS